MRILRRGLSRLYLRGGIMNKQEQIEEMCEEILYFCDRRKCDECHESCKHTQDISHAKNFQKRGDCYFEKDAEVDEYKDEIESLKNERANLKYELSKQRLMFQAFKAGINVANGIIESATELNKSIETQQAVKQGRKETAKEILQEFWKIKWGQSEIDNVCIRLAEKYGVEVEE